MPHIFRVGAVVLFSVSLLAIGIGFYRAKNRAEFRMQGFPTELSKDVVATINNYERRETDGDTLRYLIKADRATTFADNHQEMKNVYLEVFDETGAGSDKITAAKAVYVPGENRMFTVYFAGDVAIATRDSLNVRTQQLTYKKENETASADEEVEFDRLNVKGKSFGAVVDITQKRVQLLRDVNIEVAGDEGSGVGSAIVRAGSASYDQMNERIDLENNFTANLNGASGSGIRNADVVAARAVALLHMPDGDQRKLKTLEMFDNVKIDAKEGDDRPTKIEAGYAMYNAQAAQFDLGRGVKIITVEDSSPTQITSSSAVYRQSSGRIDLAGGVEVTQRNDVVKGEAVTVFLHPDRKLKGAVVRDNAYVRQAAAAQTTEIWAAEINAEFGTDQVMRQARASNAVRAVLTPATASEYSKITMTTPGSADIAFKGAGQIERMTADGRTTIHMDVPDNGRDSSNKRLVADSMKTSFSADGKNLHKAEAVGNAELYADPHRASPENYRTAINAPRFDCEFFPVGNNAKSCVASTNVRAVRTPTVAQGRSNQVLTAERMTAVFNETSRDVQQLDASGNAKFTEADRNASAANISYTAADRFVRLRGGEPTAWDSNARAKAAEIDWNTREQRSALRGNVSTTYFSQRQTGGAAPFGQTGRPVYVTADATEFDHRAEVAVFTGNARGWQDNNYVRANKLTMRQKEGQFIAEGAVQSLLYDAKRREVGTNRSVPVYASANRMTYNQAERVLRYEENADIRQGTDRLTGRVATVYLDANNELVRTDIEGNVNVTQPERRASGDYARYDAADEVVVLRGNPARIEDVKSGSAQGAEVTVFLRENRVVGEGRSKENPSGRLRTVYKVN